MGFGLRLGARLRSVWGLGWPWLERLRLEERLLRVQLRFVPLPDGRRRCGTALLQTFFPARLPVTALGMPAVAVALPDARHPDLARPRFDPASRHPNVAGSPPVPVTVDPDVT